MIISLNYSNMRDKCASFSKQHVAKHSSVQLWNHFSRTQVVKVASWYNVHLLPYCCRLFSFAAFLATILLWYVIQAAENHEQSRSRLRKNSHFERQNIDKSISDVIRDGFQTSFAVGKQKKLSNRTTSYCVILSKAWTRCMLVAL